MTEFDQLAYRNALREQIESFALQETRFKPERVTLWRWVTQPTGALSSFAGTMLDAQRGDAQLVLDFGREIVGQLAIQVTVERATTLEVHYGEDLDEALRIELDPSAMHPLPKDRYSRDLGPWVIRSQDRRAFRYVHLRVPQGRGRIQIENIWAQQHTYPAPTGGVFGCSDPLLNRIWELARHTLALSRQQIYEDSARRPGVLNMGGSRVQHLANAMACGHIALARKGLLTMAIHQRPDGRMPSEVVMRVGSAADRAEFEVLPGDRAWVNHACDWLSNLKEYWLYSGDTETVQLLWPAATQLLRALTVDLDVESLTCPADFGTDHQPDVSELWWGSRGALAMQLYWGLSDACLLAQLTGAGKVLALCTTTLSLLRRHIRARYESPQQVYTDVPGENAQVSEHVNAIAILCGLASDPRSARDLLERVKALPHVRYPLSATSQFWVLVAHYAARMDKEALDGIRAYWGEMLHQGATTGWESLDLLNPLAMPAGLPLDRCHGSAAGPAFLLPRFVLGVQPMEPGFARVQVRPQLGDLAWASGTIPTPRGEIHVHWEARPRLHGMVVLPEGVEGEVIQSRGASHLSRRLRAGENEIS
ncbi:MAG: family 78 glycoside hydrolase catalytic domain [Anaerolineae bacterium]|nr:family 78 glycoside hydrolase catalytic domain [Anaerolineae bacterium]